MAINKTKINQAYSVDKPLQSLAQEVIVANRAPVSDKQPNGDRATIGQIWCDKKNLNAYILTGYSTNPATAGASVWTQIDNSGGGGSFTSLTVNPGPTDLTGTVYFRTNNALDAQGLLKTSNTNGSTAAGLHIVNVAGAFNWYVRNNAVADGKLLFTYNTTDFVSLWNNGDTYFDGGIAGVEKQFRIYNTANAADSGTRLTLSTNNTSGAGDITLHFINQTQAEWAMGYDRSAETFALSRGIGTLGFNNIFAVDTNGTFNFPGQLGGVLGSAPVINMVNSPSGYLFQKSIIENSINARGELIYRARDLTASPSADMQNGDDFYDVYYYGKSQNGTANVPAQLNRLNLVNGAGTNTLGVEELKYRYNAGVDELHYTFGFEGSFQLNNSGGYLAVKGGAATDFIGSATLVAGTVTVNNTNIAANDKVFVTRSAVGGTPGFLSVSIAAGTSFTITSSDPGDTSTVNYFIVRQL